MYFALMKAGAAHSWNRWGIVVIVAGCALFVMSQCDVLFTFSKQGFGDLFWHNTHIILHALSSFGIDQFYMSLYLL